MKTFARAVFTVIIACGFFASAAPSFAKELSKEEMLYAGIYVRCPQKEIESCSEVKSVVRNIYMPWTDDSEKQLLNYELLEVVQTYGDVTPAIVYQGGKRQPIKWAISSGEFTMSVGDKTFSMVANEGCFIFGDYGWFTRVLTDDELIQFFAFYGD